MPSHTKAEKAKKQSRIKKEPQKTPKNKIKSANEKTRQSSGKRPIGQTKEGFTSVTKDERFTNRKGKKDDPKTAQKERAKRRLKDNLRSQKKSATLSKATKRKAIAKVVGKIAARLIPGAGTLLLAADAAALIRKKVAKKTPSKGGQSGRSKKSKSK